MIPLAAGMFDEEGAGGWGLQGWTGQVLSSNPRNLAGSNFGPRLGYEGSKVTPGEPFVAKIKTCSARQVLILAPSWVMKVQK